MTVEFEGIPYADTFAVEIRWVATREGVSDIKMECGVFVNFKKSTFLKKQIQSGTIEESMPAHNSLFQTIQEACVAAGGEKAPEEEEKVEAAVVVETGVKERAAVLGALQYDIEGNGLYIAAFGGLILLFLVWRSLRSGSTTVHGDFALLNQRVALLEDKIDAMQGTLKEVLTLLREQRA
jgi:VAD1 Analog of StAR-related lipid transfer domain